MDEETFSTLHFLPDLILGEERHYKSFVDLYGQCTLYKELGISQIKRPSESSDSLQNIPSYDNTDSEYSESTSLCVQLCMYT